MSTIPGTVTSEGKSVHNMQGLPLATVLHDPLGSHFYACRQEGTVRSEVESDPLDCHPRVGCALWAAIHKPGVHNMQGSFLVAVLHDLPEAIVMHVDKEWH